MAEYDDEYVLEAIDNEGALHAQPNIYGQQYGMGSAQHFAPPPQAPRGRGRASSRGRGRAAPTFHVGFASPNVPPPRFAGPVSHAHSPQGMSYAASGSGSGSMPPPFIGIGSV